MLREGLAWRSTALVGVVVTAVAWLGARWWLAQGHRPLEAPWLAAALLVVMAVTVLVLGRPMRRYRRGGSPVEPLRGARVLGLAQASALTGAVVAGLYLGQVLPLVGDLGFARNGELALRLALAGLGGVLVAVSGHVVQSWCRVRDDEPPRPDDTARGD